MVLFVTVVSVTAKINAPSGNPSRLLAVSLSRRGGPNWFGTRERLHQEACFFHDGYVFGQSSVLTSCHAAIASFLDRFRSFLRKSEMKLT